jgi:hypothetical protein
MVLYDKKSKKISKKTFNLKEVIKLNRIIETRIIYLMKERTIRIKPFPGRALTQKIKTKIQ